MTAPEHLYGRPWTEPEFLVVLHYYLKHRGEPRHEGTPFVQELTRTLGRTVSSILMRMENYASIDPAVHDTRVGLIHINELGRRLFEKWKDQPDSLEMTAGVLIRQAEQRDVPTLFDPSPIRIPKAFGRYELVDKVGEGRSGLVFSCIDSESGRAFAIKIIHNDALRDAEIFHRFLREIRALKSVSHRNVITLHEDNLETERAFPAFIMDLATHSLTGYLEEIRHNQLNKQRPVLPFDESQLIVQSAMDAVEALHRNQPKLIHRDINPNNLLRLPDNRWVLADFGLVKFLSTAQASTSFQTMTHRGWGTMWYTAPEQYDDFANCTEQSDVYSIGMLIWELFSTAPPPPSDRDLGLPQKLETLYLRATARDPKQRHSCIDELRQELLRP
jgi:serine/threonine protein kinase